MNFSLKDIVFVIQYDGTEVTSVYIYFRFTIPKIYWLNRPYHLFQNVQLHSIYCSEQYECNFS
jgi:hypothetical protein